TAYLAAALPEAQVLGSDDDAEAVASTRATLEASGLTRDAVRVTWDHSLAREETGSADLVLLNPPVHDGTGIDATLDRKSPRLDALPISPASRAAALPAAPVLGSDDAAEAVASARATLEASGLTRDAVRVTWDHSLAREETGSADLVLLNPPFHDGTVIDAT